MSRQLKQVFDANRDRIAALLVEPVAGNMGVIPPADGYLEALRRITSTHGALLVFDEVITGCRVARGGAQQRFGVAPDLTILGKIIGGGLPVAAYGGNAVLMDQLSPVGSVYQAGTLSGNPLAMAAGIATLKLLDQPGVYDQLEASALRLTQGLGNAAAEAGVPVQLQRVGSMMTMFFSDAPATDYASARKADTSRYASYFHLMLEHGCYFAPSQFECGFVSTAHNDADLDATIAAASIGPRVSKRLASITVWIGRQSAFDTCAQDQNLTNPFVERSESVFGATRAALLDLQCLVPDAANPANGRRH